LDYSLGVKEFARCVGAAARRELCGGNCAARFALRDLRGAQLRCEIYAARSCAARNDAARLNSNLGLN
jgi:hypothetical protein